MVKIGSLSLPNVQSVQQVQTRITQQVPLPGRPWSYRRDRGGLGAEFVITGLIYPANQATEDAIAALADGTARILDLEKITLANLEECFYYQSTPAWTDNTVEAASAGGTPFNLLAASTDYVYFGHREKFNKLWFDLQTLGSYGAVTWQYSDGSGGWNTLSIISDGTSGFSQDGIVVFTPPTDWKQDTVNSVSGKFWIRCYVASKTTMATVNQVSANLVYNGIIVDPKFSPLTAGVDETPYSLTFLQQENPV